MKCNFMEIKLKGYTVGRREPNGQSYILSRISNPLESRGLEKRWCTHGNTKTKCNS